MPDINNPSNIHRIDLHDKDGNPIRLDQATVAWLIELLTSAQDDDEVTDFDSFDPEANKCLEDELDELDRLDDEVTGDFQAEANNWIMNAWCNGSKDG